MTSYTGSGWVVTAPPKKHLELVVSSAPINCSAFHQVSNATKSAKLPQGFKLLSSDNVFCHVAGAHLFIEYIVDVYAMFWHFRIVDDVPSKKGGVATKDAAANANTPDTKSDKRRSSVRSEVSASSTPAQLTPVSSRREEGSEPRPHRSDSEAPATEEKPAFPSTPKRALKTKAATPKSKGPAPRDYAATGARCEFTLGGVRFESGSLICNEVAVVPVRSGRGGNSVSYQIHDVNGDIPSSAWNVGYKSWLQTKDYEFVFSGDPELADEYAEVVEELFRHYNREFENTVGQSTD